MKKISNYLLIFLAVFVVLIGCCSCARTPKEVGSQNNSSSEVSLPQSQASTDKLAPFYEFLLNNIIAGEEVTNYKLEQTLFWKDGWRPREVIGFGVNSEENDDKFGYPKNVNHDFNFHKCGSFYSGEGNTLQVDIFEFIKREKLGPFPDRNYLSKEKATYVIDDSATAFVAAYPAGFYILKGDVFREYINECAPMLNSFYFIEEDGVITKLWPVPEP